MPGQELGLILNMNVSYMLHWVSWYEWIKNIMNIAIFYTMSEMLYEKEF